MSKYSNAKRLRLAEAKNQITEVKMSNENMKQEYGNKCAELGHAIVQSRLLGTKIESLFADLAKLQELASAAPQETPAPAPAPVATIVPDVAPVAPVEVSPSSTSAAPEESK